MSRGRAAGAFAALAALVVTAHAEVPRQVGGARLEAISYRDLPGWPQDDHDAALRVFRRSCAAIVAGRPAVRPAGPTGEGLAAICRAALSGATAGADARAFFEHHFDPFHIVPPSGCGFLTGYFEPEYEGSLEPRGPFRTPLLARPDDLVTVPPGASLPGLDPGLQAARRTATGFEPYPDRAAIEDGALGARPEAIVHLRDAAEAFIVHVQGSARIRLPDGRTLRVAYAGRNGHPYTSIGRILVGQGAIPPGEMSLERLVGWLKEHPAEARRIMRRNRSYIFFRRAEELAQDDGPIGGAGIPLTPHRSLAVDRTLWSYGLPFWLEGALPRSDGGSEPLSRLLIAQDTGSAILGPARGDLFFGSGAAAGTRAGLLRHPVRFVVLLPRPGSGEP